MPKPLYKRLREERRKSRAIYLHDSLQRLFSTLLLYMMSLPATQLLKAASPLPPISIDTSYVWLAMYFVLNLGLTLYNKAVMQLFDFGFPWTLTGIHTLCGALGAYGAYQLGYFKPSKLGERENMVMLVFSVLYTINIAISNVSLNLVTVPVVRAMTPLFTMLLSIAFLQKSYSPEIYISLVPVVLGVVFATFGDYNYTPVGCFLTVLGTLLAALKTVATNRVQVGRFKLHPLDLLLRMSPLAFLQTMIYAQISGELADLRLFLRAIEPEAVYPLASALLANGVIAFFLSVVSFTANKKTSALTMTVAANVKQVLTIMLAVLIFHLNISLTNAVGILLTLVGGAWYTSIELKEKSRKQLGGDFPIGQTILSKESVPVLQIQISR
ncbi:uncharacterized protein VTP21DRAFT_2132 [Calcarisporiella thermophila]|uniref:uncharacterized protein n=1 Tax=Calcarisporiella thermophila TaxID=911321 RepID=UPI003742CA13